jgi:uncharacterized protein
MRFWDASAIVPLLVGEKQHPEMVPLLEQDSGMVVWWGTPVECVSALLRRERVGSLPQASAQEALQRLDALSQEWHEVAPTTVVRNLAVRMLRVHALRAADSLQLAAAMVVAEHDPPSLELVSLDHALSAAALREGFRILPVEA